MVVIKVEMWPMGSEKNKYDLGRAYIANVGGTLDRGDYQVVICRKGTTDVPAPIVPSGPMATREGEVHDYPRRSYSMWRLVIRALKACFPEEK